MFHGRFSSNQCSIQAIDPSHGDHYDTAQSSRSSILSLSLQTLLFHRRKRLRPRFLSESNGVNATTDSHNTSPMPALKPMATGTPTAEATPPIQ